MTANMTLIECRGPKDAVAQFLFLILDAPLPGNLPQYITELQGNHVSHLVCVCTPAYNGKAIEEAGIQLHTWPFDDGAPPTEEILNQWLELLEAEASKSKATTKQPPTIGIHCVAGLGRAPILVAVALVEFLHMNPMDAVALVRSRRKGAINQNQLGWIVKYQPRFKEEASKCEIM